MNVIFLDFSRIETKAGLHEYLKKQFGFGDCYGGNLDALYDEMTSVTEETEIRFPEEEDATCCEAVWEEDAPVRSEEMERLLKKVRRVIEDAAEENSHLHL